MSEITVQVDDRVRLVTAVLAASHWPEEEQSQLTHAVHPHAKQTRQFMTPFQAETAVSGVNQALLNGVDISDLFSAALRCTWPTLKPAEPLPNVMQIETWLANLKKFADKTDIVTFWQNHDGAWETAVAALRPIFTGTSLYDFLGKLRGTAVEKAIVVMPNLVYPALTPVLATTEQALYVLLPPPKAVGESPPWPYDEDPGWVVATVCQTLLPYLLATKLANLTEDDQTYLIHAATVLCLEASLDEFEAQSYLVRSKKAHNLPDLPDHVAALRETL